MLKPFSQPRGAALLALWLLVSVISCNDERISSRQSEPDSQENLTEIERTERKLGITFFKRDVIISDGTGENTVTVRIAALDEDRLNEYLASRKLSLTPLYVKRTSPATKISTPIENETADTEVDLTELLLIEIVDKKLQQNVIGLGFRNESNPDYKLPSDGRSQYINNNVRYYSPKWPEELAFQAYNQVYWRIQRQSRWYSGWSTIWGAATWCCYQYDLFNIDGPYQVRIEVSFNYSSDFYYEWFNY